MAEYSRQKTTQRTAPTTQLKGERIQRALRVYALVRELSDLMKPRAPETSDFVRRVWAKIREEERRKKK